MGSDHISFKAIKKGNFKDDFGIDVECYVLDDQSKTAVISQRGVGTALGLGDGGSRMPKFLSGKIISEYIGHELRNKIENPILFQGLGSGTKSKSAAILHGYDVTILIDICKAIADAENDGALLQSQANIAKQARVILNASAKAGIKGLVYALSGYDATREEIIESFKLYVREEAREYEREFPEALYDEWYRLYKIQKPERNRPWKFKHLTVNQVYWPLAKSSGKILEMTQINRGDAKGKKLHQFLNDVGVKALRQHLGQLLAIAKLAETQEEYEKNFKKLFEEQREIDFN